jgi:hypothetical protein
VGRTMENLSPLKLDSYALINPHILKNIAIIESYEKTLCIKRNSNLE